VNNPERGFPVGGLPDGNGEYIMRNRITVSLLVVVLLTLAVMSTGCGLFGQPGKTAAEVNRDHIRTLKVNENEMMADVDKALLIDKPSKLTERHLP
jgi:hypothetical protein